MKSIRYELKYCEGCGTLKLRPLTSDTNYCRICEDILARFHFPALARTKPASGLARVAAQSVVPQSAAVAAIAAGGLQ